MNDLSSHALVLPDQNFRSWYNATTGYQQAFDNVAIVRSPAGNNLNRYRAITAVQAPNVWFGDNALSHIRRAYPNVVTVDVIAVTTPAQLQNVLNQRVNRNTRLGTNLDSRFVLDWPTDSFTLRILRGFDVPVGNNRRHEGIDIAATRGTTVRCAAAGQVTSVVTTETALNYGQYVQVGSTVNGQNYITTYAHLQNIRVSSGQQLQAGDVIGEVGESWGITMAVQASGRNTGNTYKLPGATDPIPLIYVDDMKIYTGADVLNIRRGQGTQFEIVGQMQGAEFATPLEMHGLTIEKMQTPPEEDRWVNLDTSGGVTGYAAAWLLQARSPRSRQPATDINGVNLDLMHPLGGPDPNRLGDMQYVRLVYNVSRGRGSMDLEAAYNLYAPYIERCARAGKQTIIIFTHQTYGEGRGFVWPNMSLGDWQNFSGTFADTVSKVVSRFARNPNIAAYQIWNEQDAAVGSTASVSMSPQAYASILSRSIQAIRATGSSTPVITGGHNSGVPQGANYARATLNAMGSNIRPDGIAFHPYGRGTNLSSPFARFGHIEDSIIAYWNVMPGKRVWITEWGVLDANSRPATEINTYATSFVSYIKQNHPEKVASTIWFAWAEGMHNGYGLVNRSDQPREPLFSSYLKL